MPDKTPEPLRSLFEQLRQSDHRADLLEQLCEQHPEHAEKLRAALAGLDKQPTRDGEAGEVTAVGPYRLLDILGEGGMGTVYLAEQREPVRRRVALKLIKIGMDTKSVVRRFEQERQALSLMSHEGIARVFDVGTSERGNPYFVMELVKGLPIDEFCRRNRLALNGRLVLMQQVCAAVQHAHQKGVIHRDIKPGNVLVCDVEGRLQVKIIDFGLAKAMGPSLTKGSLFTELGVVMGTPEFMSPEQADPSNLDVDTRADIYSLGVMLYQLLVGELPFSGKELRRAGLAGMQRLLRDVDPPKPSTKLTTMAGHSTKFAQQLRVSVSALRKALKSDLDWVVFKAIEKDRSRRYQSASAMAADLQRFLVHEPLVAGPPSASYRIQKMLRRHRAAVIAAAMVLVTSLAGAVATYIQWRSALRLAAEKSQLAESERSAKKMAETSAAELDAKVSEFDRLAGRVRYDQLIARADKMIQSAPWTTPLDTMEAWMRDCDELLAMRPEVDATVASLRKNALPWDRSRMASFAAERPEAFAEWQFQDRVLKDLEYAHAIHAGAASIPAVSLSAAQRALEPHELFAIAVQRSAPFAKERTWGDPALALAAAQLALDRAGDDAQRYRYLEGVAWAMWINGQYEDARASFAEAVAAAPDGKRYDVISMFELMEQRIARAQERLEEARYAYEERPVWEFPPEQASRAFLFEALLELSKQLRSLAERQRAVFAARSAWSAQIEQLTRAHPNATVTWSAVREAVATSDHYAGCDLPLDDASVGEFWLGLVPLGVNPITGLCEFYHLRSACDGDVGAAAQLPIPVHNKDGDIDVGDDTGIVFVLLPGGRCTLGVQGVDPDGKNYDPHHQPSDTIYEVDLSPFLLARHEMTQGQWARLAGGDLGSRFPSVMGAGRTYVVNGRPVDSKITQAHPVDRVNWTMSSRCMLRHGLTLPTEAQWEYACRAGSKDLWCVGVQQLSRYANLSDQSRGRNWNPAKATHAKPAPWDDGYARFAPVGSFRANLFGMHDMHGNVTEWCRDHWGSYGLERSGDGLNMRAQNRNRCLRGGGCRDHFLAARTGQRGALAPTAQLESVGVRAARMIKLP